MKKTNKKPVLTGNGKFTVDGMISFTKNSIPVQLPIISKKRND